MYSSSVDYDNNRTLDVTPHGTGAAVLSADLTFKRALEASEISIEPRYTWRRYTDSKLGNGDERSIAAALNKSTDRSTLRLNASYDDSSTLTSELLETGIVTSDSHRLLKQLGSNWTWSRAERSQIFTQLSYMDVGYSGLGHERLPGYRYPSGSIGDRWFFSELGSVSFSVFGSQLSSDAPNSSSHEYGLQAALSYSLSERTHFDGTLGRSARLLSGQSSRGTDITLSLSHDLTRGGVSVTYSRNLAPYGIGVLAERQMGTAVASYRLTPYLEWNLSLLRIQNNDNTVRLGLDRRSITTFSTGLSWRPFETWSLNLQTGGTRTQTPTPQGDRSVSGWRGSVSLTWAPLPRSRSW